MQNITDLSDLFSLAALFGQLVTSFPEQYQRYHLYDDAVSVLYFHLQQYLSSNSILNDNHNREVIILFSQWQRILENTTIGLTTGDKNQSKINMNLYDYSVLITLIPVLQEIIQ